MIIIQLFDNARKHGRVKVLCFFCVQNSVFHNRRVKPLGFICEVVRVAAEQPCGALEIFLVTALELFELGQYIKSYSVAAVFCVEICRVGDKFQPFTVIICEYLVSANV